MRLAMLFEESEYFMELQEEAIQNEFIFNLFKLISLGGSMCQYEDNVEEYLNVTKRLYKDLVTVGKDQDTGDIKVHSYVFKINEIDGLEGLFPTKHHPQNYFFVIVDPLHWHV
eukprot:CAMPEP_0170546238 /NCGR_PEP_ID=MMETSP0211-20121228/4615_1 /TAXON_ID=311385 /ORGANISM="Pseudokeronopsis sp., Strain OXSARD2" /LENGTH=112 /DNA_ID=CAMNT_0010850605 /DNA_START=389 /DNA_END=723 /DNA_ORIENTATION=-